MIKSTLIGLLFILSTGLILENLTLKNKTNTPVAGVTHSYVRHRTVRDKMITIQRELNCKVIDGIIGQETTKLVNEQVKLDEREMFNEFAIKYFEKE